MSIQWLWLSFLAGMISTLSSAQDAPPLKPITKTQPDPTYTDVYVNDSFEVRDAIAEAERLGMRGRWVEAVRRLYDTIQTSEDRLVKISPGNYVDVVTHVNRMIAGWPREGLQAYRDLFENKVRRALQGGLALDNSSERLRLFEYYFCTKSAAKLADTIGQWAIESGRLSLAERVYRQVLDFHPDGSNYERDYRPMLAIIAALQGKLISDQLIAGDIQVRWQGQDRWLPEVIHELTTGFDDIHAVRHLSDWPMFGGNLARNARSETNVDELGLLWRQKFGESGKGITQASNRGIVKRDDGRYLSLHPVVIDDLVIVQRFREIVALHRNTGARAWRFRADEGAVSSAGYLDEQPPGWDALTVDHGRVYASLPGDTVPYYSYESARSPPELCCLDVITGKVIWRSSAKQIEDEFAEITFDSSPIVHQGKFYIIGRRRRSFGFEDCYLFRFKADSGVLECRTHLGSGSTGSIGLRQATTSIMAVDGAMAYVCTNLGSLAAVSLHTGRVQWLRLYRRRSSVGDQSSSTSRGVRPWQFNPVIVSANRLALLPTDSSNILIVNTEDGEILREIPTASVGQMETLYGLKDEAFCGVGTEVVCFDLKTNRVKWSTPLPPLSSVLGRGVWAGSRLMVPTKDYLMSYDVATGEASSLPWGEEGSSGNLLALPDQLLVAGVDRLETYVRRSQIWSTLRSRMEAAPDDPLPALEFAEMVLSNGEYDEAVDLLREAFRRSVMSDDPLGLSLRRRFFNDALEFADRLSRRSMLTDELAEELFRYASTFPPDRQAHLTYRGRFATFFNSIGLHDRAVRLYQQILRDRSLRDLPFDASLENSDRAGLIAQVRIAALIEKHGRSVYEPFEREAEKLLNSGVNWRGIHDLEQVVSIYPNSQAAPFALISHGEILNREGQSLSAAKKFEQAYHRYGEATDKPELLRSIADAYRQGGREDHAYLWLTKAAREHPGVRFEVDGKRMSFLDYRSRLDHVRPLVEPSRPDISLPLVTSYKHDFDKNVTLLTPWFGQLPGSTWSRIFVRTTGGLLGYEASSGKKLWDKPVKVRGTPVWLLDRENHALFVTESEVFSLNTVTGRRSWSLGTKPGSKNPPAVDWEDDDPIRTFAVERDKLLIGRDSGQLGLISIEDGRLLWSKSFPEKPRGPVALFENWVVYPYKNSDQRVVINLIDINTGDLLKRLVTQEQSTIQALHKTLQGQLILVTSRAVVAYDTQTKAQQWRLPLGRDLRRGALLFDIDSMYISEDGRRVRKISLNNGHQLWESQRLARRNDDLKMELIDASLIVSTASKVFAVDAITGLTQWEGTAPDGVRFASRGLTRAYVLAVDLRKHEPQSPSVAYFYDHRNASGVIPERGGALDLGKLEDVRVIQAFDDSLVIQAGNSIRGWSHKK